MPTTVKTEKELADAINRGDDSIEIEGDLANRTIKIRACGKVAWLVALGSIGIAAYALVSIPLTGGADAPAAGIVSGITGSAAVAVLGLPATMAAIGIAVAAGGVGVLSKVRDYKETSRADNLLVLRRK